MKIEIAISCIDDGRVPRHQLIQWTCKGNESRDVRMRKVRQAVIKALLETYPNPASQRKALSEMHKDAAKQ